MAKHVNYNKMIKDYADRLIQGYPDIGMDRDYLISVGIRVKWKTYFQFKIKRLPGRLDLYIIMRTRRAMSEALKKRYYDFML